MKQKFIISIILVVGLAAGLSACSAINLPNVSVPSIDRQARDFGEFSGVTVNLDGNLSVDKIDKSLATGGGNIWPLFNIDLQNDRLIFQLKDGRSVVEVGNARLALNYPELMIVVKFIGSQAGQTGEAKTLYVGPNLINCVGVAPQKCMQVKEKPEESWRLFYDQIEGFQYEEGYLYDLKITQEVIDNPPADSSTLKYKLVEVVNQTPVSTDLTATTWELETLADQPPVSKSEVTAIFGEDGTLYGSAGCNSYTTRYQVGGDTITIQPPATTRMSCTGPGIMEQETQYLEALTTAVEFAITGNRLSLQDAEGNGLVTYLAAQP